MISDAAAIYAILQSEMPLRKNDDVRRRERG
jgi:hypothetical protein